MGDVTKLDEHRGPAPRSSQGPSSQEPLWREVLGERLRTLRAERGETLAQTAERAGLSPQYLSEVERGRKEPSSEMIAALAGALGSTLAELTEAVAADLRQLAETFTMVRLGGLSQPQHGIARPGNAPAPLRPTDLHALAA